MFHLRSPAYILLNYGVTSMSSVSAMSVETPVLVLTLQNSKITSDEAADLLTRDLKDLIEEVSARYLVLDLSNVIFVSSAGLRPFIIVNKFLSGKKGRLFVCKLTGPIKELMHTVRLVTTRGASPAQFYEADDVASAVESIYEIDTAL